MVFQKRSKLVGSIVFLVCSTFVAADTPYDRGVICLANNIYFESRNQSIEGKQAVAEVVINRVVSTQFPKTICSVVTQKKMNICQFTWYCKETEYKTITDVFSYEEALEIAQKVYYGKTNNITYGALWYHADYIKPPIWTKHMRITAHIGNHIFYVEK